DNPCKRVRVISHKLEQSPKSPSEVINDLLEVRCLHQVPERLGSGLNDRAPRAEPVYRLGGRLIESGCDILDSTAERTHQGLVKVPSLCSHSNPGAVGALGHRQEVFSGVRSKISERLLDFLSWPSGREAQASDTCPECQGNPGRRSSADGGGKGGDSSSDHD